MVQVFFASLAAIQIIILNWKMMIIMIDGCGKW